METRYFRVVTRGSLGEVGTVVSATSKAGARRAVGGTIVSVTEVKLVDGVGYVEI